MNENSKEMTRINDNLNYWRGVARLRWQIFQNMYLKDAEFNKARAFVNFFSSYFQKKQKKTGIYFHSQKSLNLVWVIKSHN